MRDLQGWKQGQRIQSAGGVRRFMWWHGLENEGDNQMQARGADGGICNVVDQDRESSCTDTLFLQVKLYKPHHLISLMNWMLDYSNYGIYILVFWVGGKGVWYKVKFSREHNVFIRVDDGSSLFTSMLV